MQKNIALFDLNGTLTNVSDVEFLNFSIRCIKIKIVPVEAISVLEELKNQYDLGLVCGYDLSKIQVAFGESRKKFHLFFF